MAYRSACVKGRPIRYKTRESKNWQAEAKMLIYSQDRRKPRYAEPVRVKMTLYLIHDRDIDSSNKLLLDVLEMSDVLANDKWIYDKHTKKVKIKRPDEPRVEIEVNRVDTG